MSSALQSLLLFLLAGGVFLSVGSLASAALARSAAGLIGRLHPRPRHRALVLLAVFPLLTGLVLLLSASLPSLIALVVPARDHCLTHDDAHAHLCFVHLPTLGMNAPTVLCLVFVLSYAAIRTALSIVDTLRALRVLRCLASTGERRFDLDVTVVESPRPLCVAAGLLKPAILISRGLLESLSEDERAIVLAHEHEHMRRKDALISNLVRVCSAFHLPKLGRWLVRETEIAAEQICDEEAGVIVGDRVAVAAAILTVERAAQNSPHAAPLGSVAVAFGASAVERRVRALLAEPQPATSLRPLYLALALGVLTLLWVADPLHHATESLLSLIAH